MVIVHSRAAGTTMSYTGRNDLEQQTPVVEQPSLEWQHLEIERSIANVLGSS